jgi:hypothetical protein
VKALLAEHHSIYRNGSSASSQWITACLTAFEAHSLLATALVPLPQLRAAVQPRDQREFFMIRTQDEMNRNVGESQSLLRFLS